MFASAGALASDGRRLAQGSATIAALTTVGLVIPLIEASDVNLAPVTLATWTVLETVISVYEVWNVRA